jgi:hypothetical protein
MPTRATALPPSPPPFRAGLLLRTPAEIEERNLAEGRTGARLYLPVEQALRQCEKSLLHLTAAEMDALCRHPDERVREAFLRRHGLPSEQSTVSREVLDRIGTALLEDAEAEGVVWTPLIDRMAAGRVWPRMEGDAAQRSARRQAEKMAEWLATDASAEQVRSLLDDFTAPSLIAAVAEHYREVSPELAAELLKRGASEIRTGTRLGKEQAREASWMAECLTRNRQLPPETATALWHQGLDTLQDTGGARGAPRTEHEVAIGRALLFGLSGTGYAVPAEVRPVLVGFVQGGEEALGTAPDDHPRTASPARPGEGSKTETRTADFRVRRADLALGVLLEDAHATLDDLRSIGRYAVRKGTLIPLLLHRSMTPESRRALLGAHPHLATEVASVPRPVRPEILELAHQECPADYRQFFATALVRRERGVPPELLVRVAEEADAGDWSQCLLALASQTRHLQTSAVRRILAGRGESGILRLLLTTPDASDFASVFRRLARSSADLAAHCLRNTQVPEGSGLTPEDLQPLLTSEHAETRLAAIAALGQIHGIDTSKLGRPAENAPAMVKAHRGARA